MIIRTICIEFNYDTALVRQLRNKVNDKVDIIIKMHDDIIRRNKLMRYDAWNRICACLDRIEDTLNHLNNIKLGKKKDYYAAFDFYEYINCTAVVVDCIKFLCKIFKVKNDSLFFKNRKEIFGDRFNGVGTDEKFFEYIRSLAVAHPAQTNRHDYVSENEALQCSPFVRWNYRPAINEKGEYFDLDMMIYSSNKKTKSQFFSLSIDQFDNYLSRWIKVIECVICSIDFYNEEYNEKYKKIKVKKESDFNSIIDYILYLKNEYNERFNNESDYIFDFFILVFTTDISNEDNRSKLEKYKNAIKYSLIFLSNALQNMSFEGPENSGIGIACQNLETTLFFELENFFSYTSRLKKYSYEISKCYKLSDNNYSLYEKIYVRDLIKKIIPEFCDFVLITGDEPDHELMLLVYLELYFDCLESINCINKNIPNEINYRLRLLTEEEVRDLYDEE